MLFRRTGFPQWDPALTTSINPVKGLHKIVAKGFSLGHGKL